MPSNGMTGTNDDGKKDGGEPHRELAAGESEQAPGGIARPGVSFRKPKGVVRKDVWRR